MFRRTLLAALAAVPLVALVAQAASRFQDLPAGHWAERPATVLAERGIFPGRTPVNFAGEAPLTRYELAKVLSELYPVVAPPSTFIALSDMSPGHFATLEVQRVLGYDLMEMRRPGEFSGNTLVSRIELVTALDNLLTKSGIAPPARREVPINYRDVDPRTPLGQTLERVVNRYKLIDPKPFTKFNPYNSVPRYQALSMVLRALNYLNPGLADEIRRPAPTPAPTLAPGETTGPSGSIFASPAPRPSPAPTGPVGPLTSRVWLRAMAPAIYSEGLPTEAGLVSSEDGSTFSGVFAGGGLGGEYWSGPLGLTIDAQAIYQPLTVTAGGRQHAEDITDLLFRGAAFYKVAGESDWEAAAGAGAIVRSTYNVTGQAVNLTYLTADKLYVGGGPAGAFGWRSGPDLTVSGSAALYPVMMQSYMLSSAPKSLMRFGLDSQVRADYRVAPGWFVTGGGQLFFSAGFSGGTQTLLGVTAGIGRAF